MTTKRAAAGTKKDGDPRVQDGISPEADEATKAALAEADEANVAANEAAVGVDGEGRVIDEEGNLVVGAHVAGRVGAIATTSMKNSLATAYGTNAGFAAIFTADPGTTGTATGEVTGGAPAYARKAITWAGASNGVITGSVTFDVPAGTTVTYAGVCSSVTAGAATVQDRIAITSQNFATQGTLTVNFTFTQS